MQNYRLIGSRERDNFFYTRGAIPVCNLDSHNSLIISNLEKGVIEGVNNYALIQDQNNIHTISITETEEIIDASFKILNNEKIFYKKPKSITKQENLKILGEEEIRQKILEHYNLEINDLFEIENKKGRSRIYKLVSKEKEGFILKYRGDNLELFEFQACLLNGIAYFPRIVPTMHSNQHVVFNNNDIYALEEFMEGEKFPLDKENYFRLVGKYLALMHNEFNLNIISKNGLEQALAQEGNFLSESNLVSMKIDLRNNSSNQFFLKEIELFPKTLSQIVNSFPNQIIHGDLNKSNLIWNGNDAKIIDSENIRFSKRIRDFIPALLFEGNLDIPSYTPNSLKELTDSYDIYSNQKLSENEKNLIPELLKFSLIKSYVIYVLRRNLEDEEFKNQIISNLKIIGGEFDVY